MVRDGVLYALNIDSSDAEISTVAVREETKATMEKQDRTLFLI